MKLRKAYTILVLATAAATLLGAARPALADESDPLQGLNRGIFWFNEKVDHYLFEPVAKGYDFVMPDFAQRGVSNFFTNLRFPIVFVNTLLQGKPVDTAASTGRFLVNTTMGVGGLFDPATGMGLDRRDEDFGQTLGYWGVGHGPYIVLPLLGPSDPRDFVGLLADSATRIWPYYAPSEVTLAASALDTVNTRAALLEPIKTARETSLDYYSFVRNAYLQYRQAQIEDRGGAGSDTSFYDTAAEPAGDNDLYFPDAEEN